MRCRPPAGAGAAGRVGDTTRSSFRPAVGRLLGRAGGRGRPVALSSAALGFPVALLVREPTMNLSGLWAPRASRVDVVLRRPSAIPSRARRFGMVFPPSVFDAGRETTTPTPRRRWRPPCPPAVACSPRACTGRPGWSITRGSPGPTPLRGGVAPRRGGDLRAPRRHLLAEETLRGSDLQAGPPGRPGRDPRRAAAVVEYPAVGMWVRGVTCTPRTR